MQIYFRDKVGKRKTYLAYGKIISYADGVLTLSHMNNELKFHCLRKKLENIEKNKSVIVFVLDEKSQPEILSIYPTSISFSEFENLYEKVNKIRLGGKF